VLSLDLVNIHLQLSTDSIMKYALTILTGFIACCHLCAQTKPVPPVSQSEQQAEKARNALASPSGLVARYIPSSEEGVGKTEVWKAGFKITEIPNSRPIAFSPVTDILLLKEQAADDDLQLFLLNIGKKELVKMDKRSEYIFGGRFFESASWSNDGAKITVKYISSMADVAERIFKTEKLLQKK